MDFDLSALLGTQLHIILFLVEEIVLNTFLIKTKLFSL